MPTSDRIHWAPILSGELFTKANEAILAIVTDIGNIDPARLTEHAITDCALLYGYLALVSPDKDWDSKAIDFLNVAADRIATQRNHRITLYGGLGGIGWKVEHLGRRLADVTALAKLDCDPLEQIDQVIVRRLERRPWTDPYDLIEGLVGLGIYLLERLPCVSAVRGLELIILLLADSSEHTADGTAWRTPPEHLVNWQREACPNGYYNLGVAHGIPGIIHFLGEVIALGIGTERARTLLNGAVRWMLAHQRPAGASTIYEAWFVPGKATSDTRLGWCYGDLGIAAVLHHTALRVGRPDWLEHARAVLGSCMTRTVRTGRINDALLCHGALGVAHIYNRVYQSAGDTQFKAAATEWYRHSLEMRQPGVAIGGFPTWKAEVGCVSDVSFLSGAAGAALALLAATTSTEPAWDRLLQLSGTGSVAVRTTVA